MESSSSSGNAKQRSLAKENSNLNVNDFLDENTSKNTKKLMNQTVSTYNQTMHSLNMKEGSDSYKLLDETPVDELPNNICKFFMVVVKMDGSKFNASSLNTFFRMLIRYLKMRDENPVDISTDIRFKKCSEVVKARSLESAKAGKRPGINSAQSLTTQQLKQLMESDGMSRDNPRGLISLVHYILMTGFGCRARDECRAITNGDVVFGPESSIEGLPQYLSLSERITKTRRGSKNDKRDVEGRVYLDQDFPKLCPVRTLLYYQSKKTLRQLEKIFAFLLSVKQTAEKDPLKEERCSKMQFLRLVLTFEIRKLPLQLPGRILHNLVLKVVCHLHFSQKCWLRKIWTRNLSTSLILKKRTKLPPLLSTEVFMANLEQIFRQFSMM